MYDLFDDDALDEGMHGLYALARAHALEEAGGRFPGRDLYHDTPRRPDPAPLRLVAAYWLGRIRERWGLPVRLAFHHMGLDPADHGDALHYLFMGGVGHGVSLADKYGAALDRAREKYPALFARVDPHGLGLDDAPVDELARDDQDASDPESGTGNPGTLPSETP